jgi:hypothetical protein
MADSDPSSKARAVPASETAPKDGSQSKDAAAASESKKLPEWASFTGFIAAISIFAFITSRLYVLGLGLALSQQLAIYFTPADYLQITPVWAIPCLVIILLYIILHGILTVLVHRAHLGSEATVENGVPGSIREGDGGFWARFPDRHTFASIPLTYVILLIAVYPLGLCAPQIAQRFKGVTPQLSTFPFEGRLPVDPLTLLVLVLAVTLFLPLLTLLFFACMLTSQRNNPRFAIHGFVLKIPFLAVPFCLVLALSWGHFIEPHQIALRATSTVEIEKGNAKDIEGRMLFDLNRAIILFQQDLTQNQDSTLIVIPHEKIQKIETLIKAESNKTP